MEFVDIVRTEQANHNGGLGAKSIHISIYLIEIIELEIFISLLCIPLSNSHQSTHNKNNMLPKRKIFCKAFYTLIRISILEPINEAKSPWREKCVSPWRVFSKSFLIFGLLGKHCSLTL